MSEYWIDGKLCDFLSQIVGGGTPPRNVVDYWNGEIPWASVKDFNESSTKIDNTEEHITRLGLNNSSSNLIPAGIPIMCTRMAVGRCAISDKPIAINQDLKALFPNDNIDNQYLLILLKYNQSALENRAIGSTVKGITLSTLRSFDLSVPKSIHSQQKIAHILTTCDTVIEQTQSAIAKYKAIKQGLLHDLFTRGLTANGHLRPSYHDAPEFYKESELGMIPKEWEVKRFGDFCIVNPKTTELPQSFVYIDLESVEDGKLKQENYISKKDAPSRAQRVLSQDDVLYQMVRPYQKNNLYFDKDLKRIKYVASTGYAQLRTKESSLFLFYLVHTDWFVNEVLIRCTGSNYPAINSSELQSIYVAIPKDGEQKEIGKRLHSIDNKIKSEEILLQKYQSIKRGLMGDLLGGRKEV